MPIKGLLELLFRIFLSLCIFVWQKRCKWMKSDVTIVTNRIDNYQRRIAVKKN